jgi:hypothetical protein
MPDQLQFEGLEDPVSWTDADSLELRGKHLIADNWDVMLVPSVRGKTRDEGRWIVCHREHLESYVTLVNLNISELKARIRDLENRTPNPF